MRKAAKPRKMNPTTANCQAANPASANTTPRLAVMRVMYCEAFRCLARLESSVDLSSSCL
jgi:hypothetical protein